MLTVPPPAGPGLGIARDALSGRHTEAMDDERAESPEWRAVTAHVDPIEGGPPFSYVPVLKQGTVSGVSVYALEDPPHWHLVTFGLVSAGWGFELTLRLSRDKDTLPPGRTEDDLVPSWVVNLLANLGAYVISTGHPFAAGHHIDLRGPMRLGDRTDITAAAVTLDPRLGTMDGPDGPIEFLQVVGLTADELELCRAWRTDSVLGLLSESDRLLITRLDRPSILDDPSVRERAEAGVASDGSSLHELRVGTLALRRKGRRRPRVVLTMGAGAATGLGPALRRKLNREGAVFELVGDRDTVRFLVAEPARWDVDEASPALTVVTMAVPAGCVDELAGVFTGRTGSSRLQWLPGLRFVVVP